VAVNTILSARAGIVVDPGDPSSLVAAARRLLSDPVWLRSAGAAGQAFAREAFDMNRVSDRFEAVIYNAVDARSSGSGAAQAAGEPTESSDKTNA
jgi:glycosyltransferase involved in cell wall biosynthesis